MTNETGNPMSARWCHGIAMGRIAAVLAATLLVSVAPLVAQGVVVPTAQTPAGERSANLARVALARIVSLRLQRVTLKDALRIVGQRAGVSITYSADGIPEGKRVSLVADRISVRDALSVLLEDTGLEAVSSAVGRVTVQPVGEGSMSRVATRQQSGGTIAGHVVDVLTKAPLDQVAVRVEGPGLGTVTASDGRYTIRDVPPGTYRVTARRVGYVPLTKTVAVASDVAVTADFVLSAAPTKLNEVVTTAVGDQRRYEVGNTISTINADSIAPTAPITSLTDLISARAPGVDVIETGGLTGSGEAIRIRGLSSLVLQGDPIVIVDGVRQDNTPGQTAAIPFNNFQVVTPAPSRLNDLNFNDIQSIDVLKGPAASTEYGTDAANGVIVITTKHGTAGRPQWQVSAEDARSEIPVSFPNRYYAWGHTTDGSHTAVQCPLVPYAFTSGYGSGTGTCAVDSMTTWNPLNEGSYYSIFGNGNRQKYSLSVSGGTEAARYYVAGALSNELGVLQLPGVFMRTADSLALPHSVLNPNGENQRSIRTTTAVRLGPTADLTANGAYLSTYQEGLNAQILYNGVAFTPALHTAANGYGYGAFGPYYEPPSQFALPNHQLAGRLTGGVTGNWTPMPWFAAHATVGIDHGSLRNDAAALPQVAPLTGNPAQLGIENATTDIYTVDLRSSATAALTRTIRAVTSVGLQLADTRTQGTAAIAIGVTATNFTLNGAVNPTVTQLGDRQATLGGYGEEQIGISDRLFVTGALRIDAGSGFGRAYSTAVYPKASVSWLALNTGPATVRLRGAFGESGVQPPNGAALQLYAPAIVPLNGGLTSAVAIANVQNQRLQPEHSTEYEGGVDLGLWQNRVSVELTGYSKTTHAALVSVGTGWEAGALPYEENIGAVRNTGVEGAVSATILQARPVTWDVSLNASINRNTLLKLVPGILAQQVGAFSTFRFVPNYPVYGYWSPKVQYTDLNHDGVLEANEVTVSDSLSYAGPSLPTHEVSVGSHVGLWGGAIGVHALVDYRGGFHLLNAIGYYGTVLTQSDRASNSRAAPLWQQARDIAGEKIFLSGLDGYVAPAGFYEDATFVRFRELSLTYTLPHTLVRVLRARTLSLTGAVRNLALWTHYTGADPEAINLIGGNATLSPTSNTFVVNNNLREDYGATPLLRYWVVRLNWGL